MLYIDSSCAHPAKSHEKNIYPVQKEKHLDVHAETGNSTYEGMTRDHWKEAQKMKRT